MVLAVRGIGFYRPREGRRLYPRDDGAALKAMDDVTEWLGFDSSDFMVVDDKNIFTYLDALESEREKIFLHAKN